MALRRLLRGLKLKAGSERPQTRRDADLAWTRAAVLELDRGLPVSERELLHELMELSLAVQEALEQPRDALQLVPELEDLLILRLQFFRMLLLEMPHHVPQQLLCHASEASRAREAGHLGRHRSRNGAASRGGA